MEAEDQQALSIESQIKEMTVLAQRENLIVAEIKREAHSSKDVGQRAIFNQMIAEVREKKYNGILTWAPDRLSRNAGDLGSIVDLMDQGLLTEIRTYSQKFTNNPNEKFLLMILGSQAKLENDNKAVNVKRGLKMWCEMGWRPSTPPTGYLSEHRTDKKCQVRLDPKRSSVIRQIFEKVGNENWSGRKTFKWLNDIGFKTKTNKPLTLGNVYLMLRNTFYYGEFEYPVGGGNWYQGKHAPIITKELFDRVQTNISEHFIPKTESKEFAFTKLIKCGYCGSGITATEKFKKLKDGGANRHVYYHCCKSRNIECKNPPVNEADLIEELANLIDRIDIDELGIKEKVEQEIARFNKFRVGVLGHQKEARNSEIDIRNYTKYLLKEGTIYEQRELLSFLKSKLTLKDKKVELE
jgi:DNA invertase Pin-like site-specific DNA recombinase